MGSLVSFLCEIFLTYLIALFKFSQPCQAQAKPSPGWVTVNLVSKIPQSGAFLKPAVMTFLNPQLFALKVIACYFFLLLICCIFFQPPPIFLLCCTFLISLILLSGNRMAPNVSSVLPLPLLSCCTLFTASVVVFNFV